MTDDRDRLSLPPERDISPELRSQVLINATDPNARTTSPRRRGWVPAGAGLAAAAVVVTVAVSFLDSGDDEADDSHVAGQPTLSAPTVEPHQPLEVDVRQLTKPETKLVRKNCLGPNPEERAGRVLSSRALRSAGGDIKAAAFKNGKSGNQYFCTPFGLAVANQLETLVTNETPVVTVPGSHIRTYTPDADGSGATTAVDGAWFTVNLGITGVEVRAVVDGRPEPWHYTEAFSSFVFASSWQHLTAEQVTGELVFEYRALTADDQQLAISPVG